MFEIGKMPLVPVDRYVPRSAGAPATITDALGLSRPPSELHFYTAFLRPNWLQVVAPALRQCPKVVLRVGLDIPATPQQVLVDLNSIASQPGADVRLVRSLRGQSFHPKVFTARFHDGFTTVLGSANASSSAFGSNIEANVRWHGSPGGPEDAEAQALLNDLEGLLELDERAGAVRIWRLPNDRLPVVQPNRTHVVANPEILDTVDSDGWHDDPGFVQAAPIEQFNAPVSGLYGYADNTGRQAGLYIPKSSRETVLLALAAYGEIMELKWRFVSREGATLFAFNEPARSVIASGRGPGSHNLAITAHRSRIAQPVTRLLRSLGVPDDARLDVQYRLDTTTSPARLWLVHTLQQAVAAIDPAEVIR